MQLIRLGISESGMTTLNQNKVPNTPDLGRHAVVAIIVEKDRYLVIRRSKHVRAPNLLCFPGGGIEHGETLAGAIQRELMEELSLVVEVRRHLWSSVTSWGTHLEWMECARSADSEPVPFPDEVESVHWMTGEELSVRSDLLGSLPEFLMAVQTGALQLGQTA
jgi:8-oxo-dGTP diphosphatase